MGLKRVLRITSYAGHARYLATVADDPLGWIPRQDIPSPYAYSPTHCVLNDPRRGGVIIVETAHRRYDVFRVDESVRVYPSDKLATNARIQHTGR